jgi:16S rRNA (cytosine967-C5)-methyltransferase
VRRYLEENGVTIQETPLPEVFRVVSYVKPPAALEWHGKGYYVIQDLASAFVSHVLNPEPDEIILDLAAAPGSKTSHIAMLMENKGKIVAVDNSADRLERMKSKMKILGVRNVEFRLADGAKFFVGDADKVLVDSPCSSTGTLRTHPCVKWRYDPAKYKATIGIQRKMLKNAFRNLKDGGVAVYSTCSLTFEENEENVLYASNFFRVEEIDTIGARGIKEFRGKRFPFWDRVVRTYPHMHDCSGFFISKLRK